MPSGNPRRVANAGHLGHLRVHGMCTIGVVCAQRQQPDCLRLSATLVARRLRRTIALRRPPSGACALRVHAQVSVRTDSADSIIIAMAMPKCARSRTLGRDEPALGKPAP